MNMMNRLAKKCAIASGILHGTLVAVLILASAFRRSENIHPPENKSGTPAVLTILRVPFEAPSESIAAGPIVQNKVQDHPRQQAGPRSLPPPAQNHTPMISMREVTRPPISFTKPPLDRRNDGGNQTTDQLVDTVINTIRDRATGPVEIGLGDLAVGGLSLPDFEQNIRSIYFNNWREPADATSDEAVVKASVTIASDGTVLNARITRSSGDPAVDRSVRQLLEAVTFIAPFPPGSKDKQRTYPLSFSLKAKRGLG